MIPYPPIFNNTPARIIEIGVGARLETRCRDIASLHSALLKEQRHNTGDFLARLTGDDAPIGFDVFLADDRRNHGWDDRVEERCSTCDDVWVPLSEDEQRILRQIEQELEQDPTFSQRGYRVSRRRSAMLYLPNWDSQNRSP